MRTTPKITVTCDRCQSSAYVFDLFQGSADTWDAGELENELNGANWAHDEDLEQDICPDCMDQYLGENRD